MQLSQQLCVAPAKRGAPLRLARIDAAATPGVSSRLKAATLLARNLETLHELQYRMYAENRRALLIVLQAMDSGGKDGTIRKVMTGFNPQGCVVTSFKVPSEEERDHDFLWRIHKAVPRRGEVGIFNRSHYEDVLVVRVHDLVPQAVWSKRYEQINAFERLLADNDTVIVKFFLHIGKDEQLERLKARIDDPTKHWKISEADFKERRYWDDYQAAYADALSRCSTAHAPWYVIPANKKWYRNYAVAQILVETLSALDMQYPKPSFDLRKLKIV